MSSETSVHSFECRDQTIEKVIVFADRAEVKRILKTNLNEGINEIRLTNITQSYVHDSIRVDGRGAAVIHEVQVKNSPQLTAEQDSPKVSELRNVVREQQDVVNELKDKQSILDKRIQVLDKIVGDIGSSSVGGNDKSVTIDDGVLDGISKFFTFYDEKSQTFRAELRDLNKELAEAEELLNKRRNELNSVTNVRQVYSKNVVVVMECKEACDVQLEFIYQVHTAAWRPSYDLRVDTDSGNKVKVTYYSHVQQSTQEDWDNVPLILSTAQPCLGGSIPQLGTLDAIFKSTKVTPVLKKHMMRAAPMMASAEMSNDMFGGGADAAMVHAQASSVSNGVLSAEFAIARPAVIPSDGAEHKVTIGIVDLEAILVHETVPKKNATAFLTASALNASALPFLPGEASVYLNNSFVAKTHMKNVSPGERFSCSLGVDTAIRVEYKPAKKYHEQSGIINKTSSNVTEQTINVKNSRKDPITLVVREHLPRSTDEKIKIRIINPATIQAYEETALGAEPAAPKEGVAMTANHNLEWTFKLAGGETKVLLLKWAMDHPKEETVEFVEKF